MHDKIAAMACRGNTVLLNGRVIDKFEACDRHVQNAFQNFRPIKSSFQKFSSYISVSFATVRQLIEFNRFTVYHNCALPVLLEEYNTHYTKSCEDNTKLFTENESSVASLSLGTFFFLGNSCNPISASLCHYKFFSYPNFCTCLANTRSCRAFSKRAHSDSATLRKQIDTFVCVVISTYLENKEAFIPHLCTKLGTAFTLWLAFHLT